MVAEPLVLRIALPVPLRRCFDYLVDQSTLDFPLQPGLRVKVPFGKSRSITGILLGSAQHSELPAGKLKYISGFIDREPLYDPVHGQLLDWAAGYYHHPIGDVLLGTLPVPLKAGKPAIKKIAYTWQLTQNGRQLDPDELRRAPRQAQLLRLLQTAPAGELGYQLKQPGWRTALTALAQKGLISKTEFITPESRPATNTKRITLNGAQQLATASVCDSLDAGKSFLLYGVTGSGKTEVYIEIIRKVIAAGRQALVLVPEIGLTPQLVDRIQNSIDTRLAVLHSSLSDGERLQSWIEARDGQAPVVLGTRSAIWTPLKNPGVFIIDEEHDLSYKQQEGFRYSARDVAIMRSKLTGVPVVLGSATPSMESLRNADNGKSTLLTLSSRTGAAEHPAIRLIDIRARQMVGALSRELVEAVTDELQHKRQVLLFLNQRGFSPVIMCHACGWIAKCSRCDRRMIYHKHLNKYSCHHCNSQSRLESRCPECGGEELLQIGHGTERLAETLTELFPQARILRIDRDSTRRKGSMKKMIDMINAGDADILIGTQMLAKGHHFPKLTLVGIIDSDRGLFSADFRASERMAQLFLQVSGRAGREDQKGTVIIQTHYPHHPLIQSMVDCDYNEFSKLILEDRREANLPPYSYLAMLRVEDYQLDNIEAFMADAGNLLAEADPGLEVLGPMPAILEKKAGRLRYQLVIQSNNRGLLQRTLEPWSRSLESLASAGKVRWSLDVDPQEMF